MIEPAGERGEVSPIRGRAKVGTRRQVSPKAARVKPIRERMVLARGEGPEGALVVGLMLVLSRGEEADISAVLGGFVVRAKLNF